MKKQILVAALAAALSSNVWAGGLLTNTNQSISFLRNPARDAAIGIDGVYSNPAGVAFMPEGFHLGINWQSAVQTRTVNTTNPNYSLNVKNPSTTKEYEGKAFVPFLPSIQAAYNKGNWSYQFNFAVHGGGGRCEFSDGLGSFENAVANIANSLKGLTGTINTGFGGLKAQMDAAGVPGIQNINPVTGYSFDQSMEGKQYYFGFTLGAAYKVNEHLSLYGGARFLYGTATYKAKLENIKVMNGGQLSGLNEYFGGVAGAVLTNGQIISNAGVQVADGAALVQSGIQQYVTAFMGAGMTQEQAMQTPEVQALVAQGQILNAQGQALAAAGQQVQGVADGLNEKAGLLEQYADGVNLQSDQSAFGVAPIIGLDYRTGNFNFAVKYEFKACMMMKNKSTVDKVSAVPAVNKFLDGTSVHEDSPSMLSVGAQWTALPNLRLNAGYHHFFDKNSKKYNDEQKLLNGDTNEYLGGVEYDLNNKLTASAGLQVTKYGLSDEFMNDMSFVVNSFSYGLGFRYQINDKIALNAAYFKTVYENYDRTTPANSAAQPAATPETKDTFTRSNRVFGVGCEFTF